MNETLVARLVGARRSALVTLITLVTLWTLIGLHTVAAQPTPGPLPLTVEGISVDVQDGDTFVLRDEAGRPMRIRVAGIDAPEKSQPWADRSRQHLRELLRAQRVQVLPIKQDVFGRTVARVHVLRPGGDMPLDAAQAQIDAGLAFVRYAQAERQARAAGLGLWADPQPQAPWLFRAENRSGSAARSQRP
jgi:endonuclease YncB( thermonuclease family)